MKINQIIPSSDRWYAHFYNGENSRDLTWLVVCWALTDDGAVVGMVVYGKRIMAAPDVGVDNKELSFHGYVNQETVNYWNWNK